MKYLYGAWLGVFWMASASAASVVATIGNTPVTDADITARVALMNKQGKTSTDNRRVALNSIIDDNVKVAYASNFHAVPSDGDVDKEFKKLNLGDLSPTEKAMAKSALRADIAWQMVVARTVLPTIEISDEEIAAQKRDLEREHGLPIEMTLIRLTDIPADVAAKLTRPKSCDDAMEMAEKLGGVPQKFTAMQYELAPEIRTRVAGLGRLRWSSHRDESVILICDSKKTKEYGDLDSIIKQNATFQKAMFTADQQLKQLRRRAVIVIHDDRYKL